MSEEKHTTQNIKERILSEIRKGDVSMRPKFHFTIRLIALFVVIFAVLVISIFIFNFITFSLRISGQETLLGFGGSGVLTFLHFFPWGLLILDALLVFSLEWLLRQFSFGYKIPVLYLLGGLAVATALLGFTLDRKTLFNEGLMEQGERMPPFNVFYQTLRKQLPRGSGICRCSVLSIDGNQIIVEDTRDGTTTLKVILPLDNPLATTTSLHVGDTIFIAGTENDGVIQAFGIRKVKSREREKSMIERAEHALKIQ